MPQNVGTSSIACIMYRSVADFTPEMQWDVLHCHWLTQALDPLDTFSLYTCGFGKRQFSYIDLHCLTNIVQCVGTTYFENVRWIRRARLITWILYAFFTSPLPRCAISHWMFCFLHSCPIWSALKTRRKHNAVSRPSTNVMSFLGKMEM